MFASLSLGCGVHDRAPLVGRYAVRGTGEVWTLEDDGTCRIERGGTPEACEWVYRESDGKTRLVVTLTSAGSDARHTRRYVLTPSKWPGQPVTIPVSSSATLEKLP